MVHWRESVVSAIFLLTKHKQQKTFHGTLRTQNFTYIWSKTSHDPLIEPTGSINEPQNFRASFRLCFLYLDFTCCSPSSHVEKLFWSLWNSTKAQGILMDLHGPQDGPYEANYRGPLVKKGPAGSLHSTICS